MLLTVDLELAVTDDLLDLALLLKVGERLPGERAVDLQPIDKGGDGDQAVRLDILLELVVGGLVEDNGVLGLVLNCSAEKSRQRWLFFISGLIRRSFWNFGRGACAWRVCDMG